MIKYIHNQKLWRYFFMKITGKSGLGDILATFLQVCFWGGMIFLVALPFVLQGFGLSLGASSIVIYPNGTILLMITRQFIQLFDSLKNNCPFCDHNVKILKWTGIFALVGSFFWIFDLLYEIILAKSQDIVVIVVLLFLAVLFLGVAIALYILAELLKEATEYKKENELTI